MLRKSIISLLTLIASCLICSISMNGEEVYRLGELELIMRNYDDSISANNIKNDIEDRIVFLMRNINHEDVVKMNPYMLIINMIDSLNKIDKTEWEYGLSTFLDNGITLLYCLPDNNYIDIMRFSFKLYLENRIQSGFFNQIMLPDPNFTVSIAKNYSRPKLQMLLKQMLGCECFVDKVERDYNFNNSNFLSALKRLQTGELWDGERDFKGFKFYFAKLSLPIDAFKESL